jgi:hyperosmotically inducible protein
MFIKKIVQIAVLSAIASVSFATTAQTIVPDSTITKRIESKLSTDSTLTGMHINVSTNKGIVTLTGSVDATTQGSTAAEIAQSTDGVKQVDTTKLIVTGSTQPITDTFITAKIKGMFIQKKLFSDQDIAATSITVETNNGNVLLSGNADNQTQIDNAIQIAKSITGVKNVESSVKLTNS